MNQEDIIRMAREAELIYWLPNSTYTDGRWWTDAGEPGDELKRFAALVAAAEREACAKVCDEVGEFPSLMPRHCADSIRARGETK